MNIYKCNVVVEDVSVLGPFSVSETGNTNTSYIKLYSIDEVFMLLSSSITSIYIPISILVAIIYT